MEQKKLADATSCWKTVLESCGDSSEFLGVSVAIPVFPKDILNVICEESIKILHALPAVVELDGPVSVVGDIQGSLQDAARILIHNGIPPKTRYLFLGNYIGSFNFSLEVVVMMLSMLLQNPNEITLLRGSNELVGSDASNSLLDQVMDVYNDASVFDNIIKVFQSMPIAAIIGKRIFCSHSGIIRSMKRKNDLKKSINSNDLHEQLIIDVVKTVPRENSIRWFNATSEQRETSFGKKATEKFMKKLKVTMIIRSHQLSRNGIRPNSAGNIITIFSCTNFNNKDNKGATLRIGSVDSISVVNYQPIEQPTDRKRIVYFAYLEHSRFPPITPFVYRESMVLQDLIFMAAPRFEETRKLLGNRSPNKKCNEIKTNSFNRKRLNAYVEEEDEEESESYTEDCECSLFC